MSIPFPLGLAIFQAFNIKLLAVIKQQQGMLLRERSNALTYYNNARKSTFRQATMRFRRLQFHHKMHMGIVLGWIIQVSMVP